VIAQTATGRRATLQQAVDALVVLEDEVRPDPAWAETYGRMQPVFDELYRHAQPLYDRLDAIAAAQAPEPVAAAAAP
jgi:sugar (pentulose or hexulose) kinase